MTKRSDFKRTCVRIYNFSQHDSGLSGKNIFRVMALTALKKMIGLPVILNGKPAGNVLRGVLSQDGRSLKGIVIRGGLRGAKMAEPGADHADRPGFRDRGRESAAGAAGGGLPAVPGDGSGGNAAGDRDGRPAA